MSVIKSFLLILLLGAFLSFLNAQEEGPEGSKQFIDHPDKNEYLLAQPGTDKHKYGYELKENQHFHHTTTELDGVRLGCYGYVLNGKKYSTQYVADIKGYRPVYTYDVIEVFPKSGGIREASFIRNFNEDEDKSGNLRYFFPEGCRGFDSEIAAENNPMTPLIMKKIPNLNIPSKTTGFTNSGKTTSSNTGPPARPPSFPPPQKTPSVPSKPKNPAEKYLPPSQSQPSLPSKYLPPGQSQQPQQPISGKYITKAPVKTPAVGSKSKPLPPQIIPKTSQPPQNRIPSISASSKNGGCQGCCADEDSLPKIVIPIKLKNGKSESCPSYAKLIVPADSVNVNNLRSNPNELAKMVLSSLQ